MDTEELQTEGSQVISPGVHASDSSHQNPRIPGNKKLNRDRTYISLLYDALREGNLEVVKSLLIQVPQAVFARISLFGDTAIHIAILEGHIQIVQHLVVFAPPESLTMVNDSDETALTLAAAGGITMIAELLMRKTTGVELLSKSNFHGDTPVVVAAQFGHKSMLNFLYRRTPEDVLTSDGNKQGAKLLEACMANRIYGIALDMVQIYPKMCLEVLQGSPDKVLNPLATRHSGLRKESPFMFWQGWIYSCVPVKPARVSSTRLGGFGQCLWKHLRLNVPFIKRIYEMKLEHSQAHELLSCMCKLLLACQPWEIPGILDKPICTAVEFGNVDFITEIAKTHPDMLWVEIGEHSETLLSLAFSKGQDKVCSFLCEKGATRRPWHANIDDDGNSILHHAAKLSPHHRLCRVRGPALQMQKELQRFQELEKIASVYKELPNKDKKTPRDIFTEEHNELAKEGEKWIKETAKNCSVVATLIVTIMFAAAFTVPGGLQGDAGVPVYLHSNYFIIFIMFDILSLLCSSTSVMVFLGILTSLCKEEDFLKSLPTKVLFGLSTLFLSIAAMMIAFSATIVMTLWERFAWIAFPILMVCNVPVTIFALLHFPLCIQIHRSTYGHGIVHTIRKHRAGHTDIERGNGKEPYG